MKESAKIIYLEKVDSTNNFLKKFYTDNKQLCQKHDIVCAYTFEQTKGFGRNNKPYDCAKGGLYISLLKRKTQDDVLITLKSSLKILKILEKFFKIELSIKWINDILFHGKKCVGILCEGIDDAYCIIGIGINIYNELSKEIQDIAISILEGEEINTQVLDKLAINIVEDFSKPFNREWLDEYTRRNVAVGKECVLLDNYGNRVAFGIVVGFDTDGSVRLKCGNEIISYYSGELKFSLRFS